MAASVDAGAVLSPIDLAIFGRELHAGPSMVGTVDYRRLTQPSQPSGHSHISDEACPGYWMT